MAISPVPSTRVSDQYVSQRLLLQLQSDQTDLSNLQNQLATGNRLLRPSDDSSAALRGVAVLSLLARKDQIKTNLGSATSTLNSTDGVLANVSTLLNNVRSTAMAAVGSTTTPEQRQTAVNTINQAIQQLVSQANQQFSGQYLFAGSKVTTTPYVSTPGGVLYQGDQQTVQTYSDLTSLMDVNVPGGLVFGSIANPPGSGADLNPVLTTSTPLADLRGGQGIPPGSIAISDGAHSSVIDLSGAATIGDVARLIETHPPAGRTITAHVTSSGLTIQMDAAGGGNLSIAEVGSGRVAASLGILHLSGSGTGPVVGTDLDPLLRNTTPLANILGARSTAYLANSGPANDLIFEARQNGAQFNGVTINLVDSSKLQAGPGITDGSAVANYAANGAPARAALKLSGPGNDLILTASQPGTAFNNVSVDIVDGGNIGDTAQASYNASTHKLTLTVDGSGQTSTDAMIQAIATDGTFTAARDGSAEPNAAGGFILAANIGTDRTNTYNTGGDAKTLFIEIQTGQTTANAIMAAVNAEGTFSARLDPSESHNNGQGTVFDSFTVGGPLLTTSGGNGTNLDQAAGLQITNGGQTYTIDISAAKTVEDLLNTLNGSPAGLAASINPNGSGIQISSRLSGAGLYIGENGGSTATQLGVRTFDRSTALSSLNDGQGVRTDVGTDFVIHRKDGVDISIDVDGAQTVGDVIDLINNNATNLGSGVPVVAKLAVNGNGIELVDDDPSGTDSLAVNAGVSTRAGQDLGLIPGSGTSSLPPTPGTAATTTLAIAGANNDLVFTAKGPGTPLNGLTVSFQNTGGGPSVQYNAGAKTLVFDVDPTTTTANDLVTLVAGNPGANAVLGVTLATSDAGNDGTGTLGSLPATATLSGGTPETLTGTDTNPLSVHGAFTALIKLRNALAAGDTDGIERAVQLLDDSSTMVNSVRAEVGVRLQGIDTLNTQIGTDELQLQDLKSQDLDVDMTKAISDLLGRQNAFEAALRAAGSIVQLSLLNFL